MAGHGKRDRVLCTGACHCARCLGLTHGSGKRAVSCGAAKGNAAQRFPDAALENRAAQIQGKFQGSARLSDEGDGAFGKFADLCWCCFNPRLGKASAQITFQSIACLAKTKEAHALFGGAEQQRAEGAFGPGDADNLTGAATPRTARAHAKMARGVFINAAFTTEAGLRDRLRHTRPFGQCG